MSNQGLFGQASSVSPTLSVKLPDDLPFQSVAVAGDYITLGAGAKILGDNGNGWGSVAGLSSVPLSSALNYGLGAESGRAFATTNAVLGYHARIHASIDVGGHILRDPTSVVDGVVTEGKAVPTRTLARTATFAVPATYKAVVLLPWQTSEIVASPGYYHLVVAGPGNKIVLTSGDYYIETFKALLGSSIIVDDSNGPVNVWVRDLAAFDGALRNRAGTYPNWSIYYLGWASVNLSSAFRGTVIAPKGTVLLGYLPSGRHEGTFVGKYVSVAPNTTIAHHPMPWIIGKVTATPSVVCAGETTRIDVQVKDPLGGAASLVIGHAPVTTYYVQFDGAPGDRLIPLTAEASDGSIESMLAHVTIKDCGTTATVFPRLVAEPDTFAGDTVNLTVINASKFEDATTQYRWDFGDGSLLTSRSPAVSHVFSLANTTRELNPYNIKVTVVRTGVPNVSTTTTFSIVDDYVLAKRRGSIEPPAEPISEVLSRSGAQFVGQFRVTNRETAQLRIARLRLDQVPCDPNGHAQLGSEQTFALTLAAKTTAVGQVSIAATNVLAGTCSLRAHFWGSTASGTKAAFSVSFDMPGEIGVAPAAPFMNDLLNYVVDQGLVSNEHLITEQQLAKLYRERKIRYSAANDVFYQSATPPPESRGWCDDQNVGTAPETGFSCQPTGGWHVDTPGFAPESFVANAMKGDALLVRGCTGEIAPLMGALQPPQYYTHTGIMTQNRFQIRHSTGDVGYLKSKTLGVAGQPTDGFKEYYLRYLWPGTVTASVQQAFSDGLKIPTPDGNIRKIRGFNADESQCSSGDLVVYPRVLKPAPEFEQVVRPQLERAAEAAKLINGHYRFHAYSAARETAQIDPRAPFPILGANGRPQSWGGSETVCSEFVRLALRGANITMDKDKLLPTLSDTTNNPPDGLFYYSPENRLGAGRALYSNLYNKVQYELALQEADVDDWWWAAPAAGLVLGGGAGLAVGAVGGLATEEFATTVKWATDAPDDVASQLTNCFCSDFCSEDAKDSDDWQSPGWGQTVSPDDMLNYFDPPSIAADGSNQGGVYGFHERMTFRGKRFRPQFAWLPSAGTRTLSGVVINGADSQPVAGARVELQGIPNKPAAFTDTQGRFSIAAVPGGNLSIFASKQFASELREGRSCLKPNADASLLDQVNCDNFATVLATGLSEVRVVLLGPPETFRHVVVQGFISVSDCDCCGVADTCRDEDENNFVLTCDVSELEPTDTFEIGPPEVCADEAGGRIKGTCEFVAPSSVSIHIETNLYEDEENTCGADESEDHETVDYVLGPEQVYEKAPKNLENYGGCWWGSGVCSDYLFWYATLTNERAP